MKIKFYNDKEKQMWNEMTDRDQKDWQETAKYLKEEYPDIFTKDEIYLSSLMYYNSSGF